MSSAVPAGFKSLLNDFPLQILTEMNGKQRASEMYRTCFKKCMDTPIFHPHVIIPEVSARMYFHSALVRSNTDVGDGGVSQLMFHFILNVLMGLRSGPVKFFNTKLRKPFLYEACFAPGSLSRNRKETNTNW